MLVWFGWDRWRFTKWLRKQRSQERPWLDILQSVRKQYQTRQAPQMRERRQFVLILKLALSVTYYKIRDTIVDMCIMLLPFFMLLRASFDFTFGCKRCAHEFTNHNIWVTNIH